MRSTRLPGKVLMNLAGQSALSHVLKRCLRIKNADVVCCAIPDSKECDPIAEEAIHCGAVIFRGSETDVLDRYHQAAISTKAERVLRVTSDCPLIDPDVCEQVIDLLQDDDCYFATNNAPPSWPHGLDCEAFPASYLAEAAEKATSDFDREHVSPWMRNRPGVRLLNYAAPVPGLFKHRWTLDTPDDFIFFERLFEHLPRDKESFDYRIPLAVVEKHPDIAAINQPDGLSAVKTAS